MKNREALNLKVKKIISGILGVGISGVVLMSTVAFASSTAYKTKTTVPQIIFNASVNTITIIPETNTQTGIKETDYKVNGGSWTTYTSAFTVPISPDTVYARTIDNSGNTKVSMKIIRPSLH